MLPQTRMVVGAASSTPVVFDYMNTPFEVSVGVRIVSGAVNYTLEYSYDDPFATGGVVNWLPYPTMTAQVAAADIVINGGPITAARITNADTGTLEARIIQSGP